MIDASNRATATNKPFNAFLTIHFGALGIADKHAAQATGQFIKLASDYLRANKIGPLAWCRTRENDLGDASKGSHVHILLHWPIAFAGQLTPLRRAWVRRVQAMWCDPALIVNARAKGKVKPRYIGGKLTTCHTNPKLWEVNLCAVLSYILKGAKHENLTILDIDRQHQSGGRVIGKRAGWWQGRLKLETPPSADKF